MKRIFLFLSLLHVFMLPPCASAREIRAYVAEFTVSGAQKGDELKRMLQTLLASRLSGENILTVDAPAGADVLVSGSYMAIGKVFSIDAVAKDATGKVMARAYAQGESQDELIPAVGKLAGKLGAALARTAAPAASPAPVSERTESGVSESLVKPQPVERSSGARWISQRLTGALIGMAPGRTLPSGERELFIAENHSLRLYRLGTELKLIAEVSFKVDEQILGVDTADLDGDGLPEAYVTIMNGESLSSQVWLSQDGTLRRVAEKLPYFFRSIALSGKTEKIYAQQMSTNTDFYGDVYELVKAGDKYALRNPIRLPRFGNLYNFNTVTDAQGKSLFVVINDDGYLIVYSREGEELWRSNDKFGGSELFFKREDLTDVRDSGEPFRWTFLQQRVVVTKDNEIVVPQNSGSWVIGNSRAYKKNSVYDFIWTGASLDEKWHTKEEQNYLADYYVDVAREELVLLQVVKHEGILSPGASVVTVKKIK
jgi:hypothetical protein